MELATKQGFKQTEIGLIPKDWRIRELDHVLKFGSGQDYKHLSKGEIPNFLSTTNKIISAISIAS